MYAYPFLANPAAFLGLTWLTLATKLGLSQIRAEDFVNATLFHLLRVGDLRTRRIVLQALTADLPREQRRRLRPTQPRAALVLGSGGPDLVVYDESESVEGRRKIILVAEGKRANGPSQATVAVKMISRYPIDVSAIPGLSVSDVAAYVTNDPAHELWQLDRYVLIPLSWADYSDLCLVPAEAVWLFFTGRDDLRPVADAYPTLLSDGVWHPSRWHTAANVLRPLLDTGTFGNLDKTAELLVAMLDQQYLGRRHPSATTPLLPRTAAAVIGAAV